MKKIGIVGSRRRDTKEDYEKILIGFFSGFINPENDDIIISGGCPKGGDRFAELIANNFKYEIKIYYPDKSKLDPYLMKINPRVAYAKINYSRNTLIASNSDYLIACVAIDRKGGTEDTIKKFKRFHPYDWEEKLLLV